jgi:hypothetical protein
MFSRAIIVGLLGVLCGQPAAWAQAPLDLHAVAISPAVASPLARSRPKTIPSITVSPNAKAGSDGVNGATTSTYVAQAYRGGEYQGAVTAKFWSVGTTFGCLALSPIVAGYLVNANEHRELTSREVHVLLADCTVPLVGGWLMNRYFDSITPPPAAATPPVITTTDATR